ncbi:MAG: hypothetical protein ACR2O3_04650 [Rhizobiaceae bacterium]
MAAGVVAMVGIGDGQGVKILKKGARKFHRRVWGFFGILLPLIVLGAIYIKQSPPTDYQPVLLEAPKEN